MSSDSFKTLAAPATGEFRDRGSKFIAYAYPLRSEEEWTARLEEVKKEHPKARHHCWAYRFGYQGESFRANDDGEPSGTAGRPILGQIDSFGLTNVFVVVVRYFGGTLLGTSGLINAYKSSTQDALQKAEIITKYVSKKFRVSFDYSLMGEVMNAAKKIEAEILEHNFDASPSIVVEIRASKTEEELLRLKALVGKMSLEQAVETERIEGLEIEQV
ncbi:MAG: YigZ family protein [Saprospirales bacterium]|nr:YigZ family protein [Saprospirales bacterium]